MRGLDMDAPFVGAAVRYWGSVFPFARGEIRAWERRARAIPDRFLRETALHALRAERGNLEGAAAFATFVPGAHRLAVARAAIAFQVAFDYVDALSESPEDVRRGDTATLHSALAVALSPGAAHPNYYEPGSAESDGGYLAGLADACRSALESLPSFSKVVPRAEAATERIVAFQCHNHTRDTERSFASWAESQTPSGTGLRWWETAAAAGSSLPVFALMSAAAWTSLDEERVGRIDDAYFPWIGGLHVLLDSLVDREEDAAEGNSSLVSRYDSHEHAAERIELIARAARTHAQSLERGEGHWMVLAAMAAFYLARPAPDPATALLAKNVVGALDRYAVPAMVAMRLRSLASKATRPADRGSGR